MIPNSHSVSRCVWLLQFKSRFLQHHLFFFSHLLIFICLMKGTDSLSLSPNTGGISCSALILLILLLWGFSQLLLSTVKTTAGAGAHSPVCPFILGIWPKPLVEGGDSAEQSGSHSSSCSRKQVVVECLCLSPRQKVLTLCSFYFFITTLYFSISIISCY